MLCGPRVKRIDRLKLLACKQGNAHRKVEEVVLDTVGRVSDVRNRPRRVCPVAKPAVLNSVEFNSLDS